MKKNISAFLEANKKKILLIFVLYCLPLIAIGSVNYPYIDDIVRQIRGVGNFAEHYSRYLSEFASYAVQGSRHLTDTGLTTFILSALILTLTSLLILYSLFDGKEFTWLSAFGSVVVGINPWFLESMSFRFDAPYIALSVLVSVLPFLFYQSQIKRYFLVSIVGIFLMCNSYQGSSGIYLVMLLTLVYRDWLAGRDIKTLFKKVAVSALAYAGAIGLYFLQTKLNPNLALRGDTTSIASLSKMPQAIITNLNVYFITIKAQSTKMWIVLTLALILLLILFMVMRSQINKVLALALSVVYIPLAAILSFGLYMFFSTPLADNRPRYEYGFAFLIAILLILVGSYSQKRLLNYAKGIVVVLLTYYALQFSFVYASALDSQKEAFESSSVMLAEDLNDYVTKENETVYISSLFKNSPAYLNTQNTYPILKDLVPSNSNLYWPNLLWFNTLTNLNVNLVGFDFNTIDMSRLEKVEVNKYWTIYRLNDELYVYMN